MGDRRRKLLEFQDMGHMYREYGPDGDSYGDKMFRWSVLA